MTTCTRCEGTGFLNLHQIDDMEIHDSFQQLADIQKWIKNNSDHDVQVCDCCGDGEGWWGTPGEHYSCDDPRGERGPYAYNGGLCECD